MSRVELAPEVSDDFDRILDHLAGHDVENAPARIREIIQAFNVLETVFILAVLGQREAGYKRG